MNSRFGLILAALVVGFAGIFWFTKHKNTPPVSNSAQLSNHVKGDAKTSVNLTEYGDLQCPACWEYEPIIQQVYAKYKSEITFQFRNFPLTQIHQNAMAGHRAVEAASLQGKFWEMHDLLYQRAHQQSNDGKVVDTEWTATSNPQPFFEQYAQLLGLDLQKFKTDMKSESVNNVINADVAEANKLKFTGTPSFTLNGKAIDNPRDLDGFSKLIDAAIAAAKKT